MGSDRKESGEIGRATGILAASTFLSRILGLVRNQILSHFFGAGFIADAFIAAFTIPNALRRLFGEGALTPAFVSIFTRSLDQERPQEKAKAFFQSAFSWLSYILIGLTLIGILASPALVFLYVPEFRDVEGKFEITVSLTRFLFPFILLISWAALFMGVLNSLRKFALPALGPAVLNLCTITITPAVLLWWKPQDEIGIFVFGGAILIGAIAQILIQLPALKQSGCLPKFVWPKRDPQVLELIRLLVPSIFAMGIYQLNIIVNRVFASDIPGAVSHLFYADLIVELPVSLIATSMAVAAVPSFTRLLVQKDRKALGETFYFSFSLNSSLALPATAGVLVLAGPILSSIFFTGEFDANDWRKTTQCLLAYGVGMPFFCLLRSLIPLFYAEKDTRTPAYVGVLALIVNFACAWQLAPTYGGPGIALATSISSLVNFSLLFFILYFRNRDFPWKRIGISVFKSVLASLVMLAAVYFLHGFIAADWSEAGINILKILSLSALVLFGVLSFALMAFLLRLESWEIARNRFLRRRN